MDIEVRIRGLMMDPATSMPIVVLKDIASETVMPIWVGIFEANAIALEIEKVAAPRPMTHDLTRNLIHHLNATLERVVISELKDDTFFAVLWLKQGNEPVALDARPSDAIALALRADCPIYVTEQVMQMARLNTSGPAEGPTAEQLRGWLEGLNDEDLGRYKMYLINSVEALGGQLTHITTLSGHEPVVLVDGNVAKDRAVLST